MKPPPEAGDAGEHERGEEVEALAHRHERAGHREDEDADEVEHDQRGGELGRGHVSKARSRGRRDSTRRRGGRAPASAAAPQGEPGGSTALA